MDKAEKTYDLADVFKIFPSCLSDRNLLKTVLLDVFPTDRV